MSNTTGSGKVIVRADKAGVFYGEIVERRGDEVDMVNVRRVHYWQGAASLSQMSQSGVREGSRITVVVPSMTILGVIEILPCSPEAIGNLDNYPVWKV